MKAINLAILILFCGLANEKNSKDKYQILNDLLTSASGKEKLSIYYQFNTETFWIDNLKDSVFLANAMIYSKEKVDLFDFVEGFDFKNAKNKISTEKKIDKKNLNRSISVKKKFKEPISEFSCPIIAEDKAIIFQRSKFVTSFEYLLLLQFKDDKWIPVAQILLKGDYIDAF
jgi:hypothetical protein